MKFREIEAKVADLPVFCLNDVRKIDSGFHRQQLSYWQNKNLIKPVGNGYYILANRKVDETLLFMIANKIYEPSYISLESALGYYQVIPESVLGVTSVSSRKTNKNETEWGALSYRRIKPELLTGFKIIGKDDKWWYKMADLEKAVLDYLYLNSDIETLADFEGLRWNKQSLAGINESQLFVKYLAIFNSKALGVRVKKLSEFLQND
jgi:predicted transcriptional regulator of viral defense system